jgi:hypothetical protein
MAKPTLTYAGLTLPAAGSAAGLEWKLRLNTPGGVGIATASNVAVVDEYIGTLMGTTLSIPNVSPNITGTAGSTDVIDDPEGTTYILEVRRGSSKWVRVTEIIVPDQAGTLNIADLAVGSPSLLPSIWERIKNELIAEGFQEGQQGIQGDPGLVVSDIGDNLAAPRPATDGAWFAAVIGDAPHNAEDLDVALVYGETVAPEAPVGISVRGVDEGVEVTFAQPPDHTIAGFQARAGLLDPPTDGTAVAGVPPIAVGGLTNGTPVYVQARSINGLGFTSPWSTPTVMATPSPAPRIRQVAAAGIQSATVVASFEEPAVAGSLLVAIYARGMAGAGLGVATPSGWTLGASVDELTRHRMLAFWAEADGGEVDIEVHATQGGPRCDLIVVELEGADTTDPFDVIDTEASFDASSMLLTGSTTVANTQVLAAWSLKHETGAGISAAWSSIPTNGFVVAEEETGRMRLATREKLPASGLSTELGWSNDDASAAGLFIGIKPA